MKNLIVLLLLIITQSLGDMWLSKGMKVFGSINFDSATLTKWVPYFFTSPWIWLGIATLIVSLLLYMTAISRLDLSYVLPIHSFTHVLNAILAWLVLGETVSGIRWLATAAITIGVLIVGLSQQHDKTKNTEAPSDAAAQVTKIAKSPVLLFPVGLYLSKIWLGVLVCVGADAAGDVLTAVGMKQIGRVSFRSFPEMLQLGRRIFLNRVIISAITFHAIAFFVFLSLLSWADFSLVRPATSLTYVASLLGARFFLKERMTLQRLMGVAVIGSGVMMISYS